MSNINFYNVDCMEFMASVEDKHYDLAIVDPPYFIGAWDTKIDAKKAKEWNTGKLDSNYIPELKRISKNQIIWGANYFEGLQGGRIIHNKLGKNIGHRNHSPTLSDADIAYQSFNNLIKMFSYTWIGNVKGNDYKIDWNNDIETKIHPCQKPIVLYRWLLQKYAKPGQLIFDSHGGSMSIAIACDMEGFDLDICELDKEYFDAAVQRFNIHKMQKTLF